MATDTRATHTCARLTIADVCQAIETGAISFARKGNAYSISALDLRRIRRRRGVVAPLVPRLLAADAGDARDGVL